MTESVLDTLSQDLRDLLEQLDAAEVARVLDVLTTMTKRERELTWELVTAAYTCGLLEGAKADGPVKPPDPGLMMTVTLLSCLQMPDLAPTVERLGRVAQRRRKQQGQGDVS